MGSQFALANESPIVKPLNAAVNNIGVSKDMIIEIPVGSTYLDLVLDCRIGGAAGARPTRANFGAMWTRVRFMVAGKEMWSESAADLISYIEYDQPGLIGESGLFTIPFWRPFMRFNGKAGTDPLASIFAPAYGLGDQPQAWLEITQAAGNTIDYVVPRGKLQPKVEALGAHLIYDRQTPTFSSTGFFDYIIPLRADEWLYRLDIKCTVANLAQIIVEIDDQYTLINTTCDVLKQWAENESNPKKTWQSGFAHLDFAVANFDQQALVGAQVDKLVLRTNWSVAPGTFQVTAVKGTTRNPNAA